MKYSKINPLDSSSWLSRFESFGVLYLKKLKEQDQDLSEVSLSDNELVRKVRQLSLIGILLSAFVGFLSAFLSVYIDVSFEEEPWWIHYGLLVIVTSVATVFEIYFLFLIALKTVYQIADMLNIRFSKDEKGNEFPFSIEKILARTALELSDPKHEVLGIDAFRRVPDYKLVLIGITYKLKIVLSNFLLRTILNRLFGRTIMRISVSYIAVPVTGIWNAWVLYRVSREARLRIFGYMLSNHIATKIVNEQFLSRLSEEAKVGCIRAIANAVVLTRNYHPNMILLLLRFKDLLKINQPDQFDDWDRFIETLNKVSKEERYLLLDILTISASFDGKVSKMEKENLEEAYQEYYSVYYQRLKSLTTLLRKGRLNECKELCKIDFIPG